MPFPVEAKLAPMHSAPPRLPSGERDLVPWAAALQLWLSNELGEIRRSVSTIAGGGVERTRYTITNLTESRTLDADTAVLGEVADALGTLISDLQGGES